MARKIKWLLSILILTSLASNAQSNCDSLAKEILKTWEIHNSMNLKLLDAIPAEQLVDHSSSGGRNVGEQFAHIHNVRAQWLSGVIPGNTLTEISSKDALNKNNLVKNLAESSQLVGKILNKELHVPTQIIGSMTPVVFLGYLISHESHQRGQIILSLKQSGHPVSNSVGYGIWNWGKEN